MVRLALLSLLVASGDAGRAQVTEHVANDMQLKTFTEMGLSATEAQQAMRALDIMEELKSDSDNVALQEEYKSIIGEVEWAEEEVLNEDEDEDVFSDEPVALGGQSEAGSTLNIAEMLSGNHFMAGVGQMSTRAGRFFTRRRDYVAETGGEAKYLVDGRGLSLHSRMYLSEVNEQPKYIIRRAFNYLNPVARIVGQYMYRVIECRSPGWGCREGTYLYTITKDRLGRGALWGQDEFRVYKGQGGCGRSFLSSGVFSCTQADQILYSISGGLPGMSFDTKYYEGNIKTVNGNRKRGTLYGGTRIGEAELADLQVAELGKKGGPPRALNWPYLVVNTPVLNIFYQAARELIWTDSYQLTFNKATDEMLVTAMACVQDLARDTRSNTRR